MGSPPGPRPLRWPTVKGPPQEHGAAHHPHRPAADLQRLHWVVPFEHFEDVLDDHPRLPQSIGDLVTGKMVIDLVDVVYDVVEADYSDTPGSTDRSYGGGGKARMLAGDGNKDIINSGKGTDRSSTTKGQTPSRAASKSSRTRCRRLRRFTGAGVLEGVPAYPYWPKMSRLAHLRLE